LDFGRSRPRLLRWFLLAAVSLAVVLGVGGLAGAANNINFTTASLTSVPGSGAIPYTSASTTGDVQYEVKYVRDPSATSNLSGAVVNEPVTIDPATQNAVNSDFPVGSSIVSVTGCPTVTYRDNKRGLTCSFRSLKPRDVIDLIIVVQTPPAPTGGADTSMSDQAALTYDQGGNNNQPSANTADTVPTNILSTGLTADTSSVLNTFALPNNAGNFQTSGNGNQQSQVGWSGANGFPGGALALVQCWNSGTHASNNCSSGTPDPCVTVSSPGQCTTQTSIVTVPGSGGTFFQQNPMTIILTFFASELGAKFNINQFTIYHDGSPVSSCKTKPLTDPTGDCIKTLVQDKTTGNVTATITGPSNGGWGGK
jgi:hypothetical protein